MQPDSFIKKIKTMRKRYEHYDPTEIINDENGRELNNPKLVLERWRQYFNQLLNLPTLFSNHEEHTNIDSVEFEPSIIKSEIIEALRSVPKNKTAGEDNISIELIQTAGETGITCLHRIFNLVWSNIDTPQDWKNAVIIPIWKKKGIKRYCSQ
jgi:hypothetical protein